MSYEMFTKSTLKEVVIKLYEQRVNKESIKKYVDATLVDEVFKEIESKERAEQKKKQEWDRLTFTLTDEHVKLLRRVNIGWTEDDDGYVGHWELDAKRPYGNSDIEDDIRSITGKDLSDHQSLKYHEETKFALEILVQHGIIKTGVYKRKASYTDDWNPADLPKQK